MGDPVAPERPGERSATARGHTVIPGMPVILPSEQVQGAPYPLLDGIDPTLGWDSGRQPRTSVRAELR
jgi:hypothetical protein